MALTPIKAEAKTPSVVVETTVLGPLPAILERIAICESSNDPKAKNPVGTASGRFQFISSSWEHYGKQLWGDDWIKKDVFNWNDNTELAYFVYKLNGTADWSESKPCWNEPI